MQDVVRLVTRAALLTAAFAIACVPGSAAAQSGSAGGSIGNTEKSLSGTRATPRTVEPAKPARRSKPAAETTRPATRKSSGSAGAGAGGSFDGAWSVSSVGTPCGGATEAIVITSGRIIGQYTSGRVSPNGSTTGAGSANGISWTSSGRFSARSGSGSFRRSDGCVGRWTASKQ
ncbi:hypothetical protein SR870_02250 [Rhodopseudomonas palustris]|uniref:hypothetical protein n=1 Tax=Rhodopseudomonas palustris TaxID=1076 RepID=UPI002ACE15B5|nr:hypothetical protein [Rhodopseudomonas palustris]WQH00137.1 hypothetical protein SR870_02250 [Rhodopseudomonas palustris]